MQLIEPTLVDIKKNMSTLGEVIANDQINGAIVDKENDVCGKITQNKNVNISDNGETTNDDNSTKEQLEDKVKSLNGIVKKNGDAPTISEDSYKIETEINAIIADESAANSQSNGNSSFKPCESTNGNSSDIDTAVNDNTNLENKTIDLNEEGITSEKEAEAISLSLENTGVSLSEKEIDDAISIENKPEVQSAVSNDEFSEAEKSKSIEISIAKDDMASNISAFSPNSDTNEEINISAQLQQLENDASIEDYSKIPLKENTIITTNQSITLENENFENNDVLIKDNSSNLCTDSKVLEKCEENSLKYENEFKIEVPKSVLSNDKPASPEEIEKKLPTEKNDTSDACELDPEKIIIGDQGVNGNIALEMDLEITPSDNKPDNSADISVEKTPSIENNDQDKCSMEIVNDDGNDLTNNKNEKIEVLDVATSEQSTGCSGDVDMEVDDCKPIEINLSPKLEISKNEDACIEKEVSVQKYITVKKFTDMVYPTACTTTSAENIEVTDISDGKLTQIDQVRENEDMEVDALDKVSLITTENIMSLDSSNQKLPVMSTKVEMVKDKLIEDAMMEKASEICKENEVMSIEQQENDSAVMEIDSAVTEIKDCDEVPTVEKTVSDIVDKDKIEDPAVDDIICEKPSAVINIIDNDDEDIKSSTRECSSVENCVASDVISVDNSVKGAISEESQKSSSEVEIVNEVIEEKNTLKNDTLPEQILEKPVIKPLPVVCKLSNTMDILSDDDEEDLPVAKPNNENKTLSETLPTVQEQNKCINIDDDDDIMFIEDTNSQDVISEGVNKSEQQDDTAKSTKIITNNIDLKPASTENKINSSKMLENEEPQICEKDSTAPIEFDSQPEVKEPKPVEPIVTQETKPLITKNFLKSVTKNLSAMTRNELEDFCVLKLVECVVDKSNLSEIKNKMKTMAQTVEDLRKKSVALTKQNRDLQVVVKTVQEDLKKKHGSPMMPMKITRSVGMQVVLSTAEKNIQKKKLNTPAQVPPLAINRPVRNIQSPKTQKPIANNIPVPRLVPASSPTVKSPATPVINTKPTITPARNTTPQRPEKRPFSKSPASSVTVDLTDDEPPAKINTKNPTPPVRLVPSQSLMPPKNKPQFIQASNSPRKVYIPISSSNPNVRPPAPVPAPTVMKNFVPTPRPRQASVARMQTLRVNQLPPTSRHPAPLPDAMKQYQPPAWKALPPAPDLKLSKVDNGIVISWKFEGYQPETYEEVASFQLYAYQETTAPPSTALWKKIGDIKALPLPMACTLTQFMSGFKYYFAVRAIDVRSRIGPFSLPGSILLISKN